MNDLNSTQLCVSSFTPKRYSVGDTNQKEIDLLTDINRENNLLALNDLVEQNPENSGTTTSTEKEQVKNPKDKSAVDKEAIYSPYKILTEDYNKLQDKIC